MELFRTADYIQRTNPDPGKRFTEQLLEKKSDSLVGMFIVAPPGAEMPYHYHNKRESVMVILSGTGKELLEGKKVPIQEGDILFLPAKEKHGVLNDGDGELRFIEFQVGNPNEPDRVQVDWKEG
jgi:mannose-6-phosphate isomerase-like protein (cupin superfamily)